jgi:hypothetical protein
MSLLVIFYVLALRVADGLANAEETSRRETPRDLPVTRSHFAEKVTGGRLGNSGLMPFVPTVSRESRAAAFSA